MINVVLGVTGTFPPPLCRVVVLPSKPIEFRGSLLVYCPELWRLAILQILARILVHLANACH